jgi:fatty-acyl-CoA synthase
VLFRGPDHGRNPFHDQRSSISCSGFLYNQLRAAPDLIIEHSDFLPLIDDMTSGFNRDIIIVQIGDGEGYEEWIGDALDSYDFLDIAENQTGILFYTTGTTGNHKGVSYWSFILKYSNDCKIGFS